MDKKSGRPVPLKAKLLGEPLYQTRALKKVLDNYFFEDKVNLLVKQISIPTFEDISGDTLWFENDVCEDTSDWPVAEAVQASMMAPGFFESMVKEDEAFNFEFLDGGIAYNNPAKHMVCNAVAKGAPIENIFVLSIGSGKTKRQGRQADKKLFWEEEFEGHSMTRQSEDVHEDLLNLLPKGNYIRIQPELDNSIKFDAIDEQSIE